MEIMEKLKKLIEKKIEYEGFSISTRTTREQSFLQRNILELYESKLKMPPPTLLTTEHAQFVVSAFENIPPKFISFTSSQPWYIFYILHSLKILKITLEYENLKFMCEILAGCLSKSGGFGGGYLQEPHLGCTFAAILSIMIISPEIENIIDLINVVEIGKFLQKCKNSDGSFRISPNQETDMRATYCAIAIYKLLNLKIEGFLDGIPEYIASCQNYDGGFGALVGTESHAGYTYCAYASLVMLGREDLADHHRLLSWAVHRQVQCAGGFQGRCNKLVDSCYSFWCGALIPLLQAHSSISEYDIHFKFMDKEAQDIYLLLVCQNIAGGFTDRLLHNPDVYHTCYSLSSLALFHNSYFNFISEEATPLDEYHHIERVHPLYNITTPTYDLFLKRYYNSNL